MGRLIVKQPDGNFALWSTISDQFLVWDATPQEIIDYLVELKREEITKDVLKATNPDAKEWFTYCGLTWKEALSRYKRTHKKEFDPNSDG